jgi:excinuclease UvrABC nuclease subunit
VEWLAEKAGRKVRFEYPQRGKKLELLKMAEENAKLLYMMNEKKSSVSAEDELAERLGIRAAPDSIAVLMSQQFRAANLWAR